MANRGERVIAAAGGVAWRIVDGTLEIVLVHRPKYDDWSLPKGKLGRGEDSESAALREVAEETGLRCVLGSELTSTFYIDRKGRPKRVRYWAMEVRDGAFTRNSEVDEIRWLRPDDAARAVSYARDATVIAGFVELLVAR